MDLASKADFVGLTGKFKAHKNTDDDKDVVGPHKSSTPAAKVIKRPREVLVCNACRKSKLRCDRSLPCGSCVRRDEAAHCSYQRPPQGSKVQTKGHSHTQQAAAEERLQHLESLVMRLMEIQASAPSSCGDDAGPAKPVTLPDVTHDSLAVGSAVDHSRSGQGDEPPYVGSTHWSAIMDDIHELKVVLASNRGADDEESLPSETTPAPVVGHKRELIFGDSGNYSVAQVLSQYLPSRLEADRLLAIFFKGESLMVTFVHTYQFQRQYRGFWADTGNVNPLWLSLLFSIWYIASVIRASATPYGTSALEDESFPGDPALHMAAGRCLVLGNYHRPQPFAVEALSLYGHSKSFRTLDSSREAGRILGMVIRMSYEMGYHRDPDALGSFTVFEGEIRRRFWAAVKQMDLMTSFQMGIPSIINFQNCDTRPPRNLNDSDFDEDTQVLPPSRPETEVTRLLWLIVRDRQMESFSKVCQDALSVTEKSEAEIIQHDQEVRQMYATIPEILRTRPLADSIADDPLLIQIRIHLEFIYLKSVLVLHRRYMARGYAFSTRECIDAGKKIVAQCIEMFREFGPGGQLYQQRWMLTNYTMNDFLLAIMILCLAVHTRCQRVLQNLDSVIDSVTEREILALLEQAQTICIEQSEASRDSRRVSHALRLLLNGVKPATAPNRNKNLLRSISSSTIQAAPLYGSQGADFGSLTLEPQQVTHYDENAEEPFGLTSPFAFMGTDFDDMYWAMFEPQLMGQELPTDLESFTPG